MLKIIGSGFGISEAIEHNGFYVVYTWIMDIAGPFIMIGAALVVLTIARAFGLRTPLQRVL